MIRRDNSNQYDGPLGSRLSSQTMATDARLPSTAAPQLGIKEAGFATRSRRRICCNCPNCALSWSKSTGWVIILLPQVARYGARHHDHPWIAELQRDLATGPVWTQRHRANHSHSPSRSLD